MEKSLHPTSHTTGKNIVFGAIGGLVAGLVMAPFLMIAAILAGMPPETMPIAMGLMFGASYSKDIAMVVGFGMHMLTSILIGIIFGAVISVKKFWITGFRKGIVEGLITGMIAFVVLFIPIGMSVMPILMKMAAQTNPTMTEQQVMLMMQQNMPMMMGVGILEHLVYGTVLGSVTTALILKTGMERGQKHKQEYMK
jgi:hypothetical protein